MNTGPVLLIGMLNIIKFTSYSPSISSFGKLRSMKNSFLLISTLSISGMINGSNVGMLSSVPALECFKISFIRVVKHKLNFGSESLHNVARADDGRQHYGCHHGLDSLRVHDGDRDDIRYNNMLFIRVKCNTDAETIGRRSTRKTYYPGIEAGKQDYTPRDCRLRIGNNPVNTGRRIAAVECGATAVYAAPEHTRHCGIDGFRQQSVGLPPEDRPFQLLQNQPVRVSARLRDLGNRASPETPAREFTRESEKTKTKTKKKKKY
ncbi:hypothetical protein AGLY_005318 [Aphis glycines]|uniref:Uncharacterized protein n=1 Tax=Aphis glycines TaxID=307491 RepID=A0A6G0TXP6_APHGL|nr:hypothetical protein AGLY_005318 [Aphis glycines]